MVAASVISLAIGFSSYAIAASKCIKGSLSGISEHLEQARTNSRSAFDQLTEFIQFHSQVKQLSNNFR